MADETILYHPIDAPEGWKFAGTEESLRSLADQGWVDNPAKIGVNAWSDKSPKIKRHIQQIQDSYLSGEIPGIGGGAKT